MKKSLLASILLAPFASADLEVHEWGTFTTLASSNGTALDWYLPTSDISSLPKFVERNPGAAKLGFLGRMRMETPVVYFYPDEPMKIKMEATFQNGWITEMYPRQAILSPLPVPGKPMNWEGDLFPPDHQASLALIPEVSSEERGAHYAAARAVPDAWILRHQFDLLDPKTKITTSHEQAEKFIFYRGVGQSSPGLRVHDGGPGRVAFANGRPFAFQNGVLLEIRENRARWAAMPEISPREKPGTPFKATGLLPNSWSSLKQVEEELTQWFHAILAEEGLTPDEARAMVSTWRDSWFREPGLRAFSLLPRAWVDQILPLKIEPTPDQLVRVFVARFELLSKQQEETLTDLLMDDTIPNSQALEELRDLGLGRFEHAAVQQATEIAARRMNNRYQSLKASTATSMR